MSHTAPKFVAELSINHLGVVEIAKRMIKAAKSAGADFVKLKMKNVDNYYTDQSKKWKNFNFIKYRKSLELSKDDFKKIDRFCTKIDIPWFATVHDEESRDFIRSFDPPFYKIASMDSGNNNFVQDTIDICKKDSTPLVISMGGKSYEEERKIIDRIKEEDVSAYVLHCVSIYPTPEGQSNIGHIKHMKEKYEDENISIGYSGHENGIAPSVLSAVYGASLIERHLSLSKNFNIHHIDASIEPDVFSRMTSLVRKVFSEMRNESNDHFEEELNFLENREYT
jgi:N-acetylneuraminate synthase